jgi:hypothetical protein
MLSHVVMGGFGNPNKTWLLYDRVRSGAVHGEDVPEVSWEMARDFSWVVRRTLNQYLTVVDGERIVRRGRLLKLLAEHPDRPKLIEWLRVNGGTVWTDYLDKAEGEDQGQAV